MTSITDKTSMYNFKATLSHYLFGGDMASSADKEYTKAINIPPGLDTMGSIGEPKV